MANNILENLINYLLEKGYPKDSLLNNYMIGKFRADLVVVDIITHTPLQIFVIKDFNKLEDNKIKNYVKEAGKINPDIIIYIVEKSAESPFFSITDYDNKKSVQPLSFNYDKSVQKGKNASNILINNNKTKAVGSLKLATFSLVIITFLILLMDVLNIIEVTGYRLYLILIIVILVLLPYYESIKVSNFELKQKDRENNKDI
ncbi:MAG: hypothetical protein IJ532_01280 [Alphaproteobacteria bacterium]|nr:hypothetical protein [Alphaproteobacteria bacterium]